MASRCPSCPASPRYSMPEARSAPPRQREVLRHSQPSRGALVALAVISVVIATVASPDVRGRSSIVRGFRERESHRSSNGRRARRVTVENQGDSRRTVAGIGLAWDSMARCRPRGLASSLSKQPVDRVRVEPEDIIKSGGNPSRRRFRSIRRCDRSPTTADGRLGAR